jgi:DNA-binding MarR family transcriptional regulator
MPSKEDMSREDDAIEPARGGKRPAVTGSVSRRATELFLELMMLEKARLASVSAGLGLSPIQAGTLWRLLPGQPLPMSGLAVHMACEPSNVTGIVDKLEARGLVERRPGASDRRLTMLVLTADGVEMRDRLLRRLREPPRWMRALKAEEQEQLLELLHRSLELSVRGMPNRGIVTTTARSRARPHRQGVSLVSIRASTRAL